MATQHSIEKYIRTDIDSVPRAHIEDTVGSALDRTGSSHEPVFVYDDDNNEFKGVIYTSQSLFTNNDFYLTKVKSALMVPPRIYKDTPLYRLAEFMIMTRLYILPVFDKPSEGNTLIGIVRVKDILADILKDSELYESVESHIKIQKPITMSVQSTVRDIYGTMKKEKVSRVILVNKNGLLVSIVSRRDIQSVFTSETTRQRFGNRMPGLYYASYFDEEKVKRDDESVTAYSQASVLTAKRSDSKRAMLKSMVSKKKNGIVIVKNKKPIGYLSRSDFVSAIAATRPEHEIPVILADSKDQMTQSEKMRIIEELSTFGKKIKKQKPLERMEVTFKTNKNSVGYINEYEFTLQYMAKDGDTIVAHAKGRQSDECIRELVRDAKRQIASSKN